MIFGHILRGLVGARAGNHLSDYYPYSTSKIKPGKLVGECTLTFNAVKASVMLKDHQFNVKLGFITQLTTVFYIFTGEKVVSWTFSNWL